MVFYETTQSEPYELVIILRDAAGDPLSGLVSSDVTLMMRKPLGTFVAKTLDDTNFFELDDTNAPGYYGIRLSETDTDTVGNLVLHVQANPGAGLAREDVTLRVHEPLALRKHLGSGGTVDAPAGAGLWDVLGDGSASLLKIQRAAVVSAGLSQENFRITDQVYDTNNNLTSAVVRVYPSATDTVNQTNALAAYSLVAAYSVDGLLTDYRLVKTSEALTEIAAPLQGTATIFALGELN